VARRVRFYKTGFTQTVLLNQENAREYRVVNTLADLAESALKDNAFIFPEKSPLQSLC
jgi:hypothetical protein